MESYNEIAMKYSRYKYDQYTKKIRLNYNTYLYIKAINDSLK